MGPFQDELAFYGFVQLNMFENAITVSVNSVPVLDILVIFVLTP